MRITNSMMLLNAMRDLRTGQGTLFDAQNAAITGRRIRTVSDDPIDAAQVMRLEREARDLDQFVRNGASAQVRLSTEDTVLSSVRSVLARAKSLAMGTSSDDPASPDRTAALADVRALRDQLISLGNTTVAGESIFAGGQTLQPAFRADGTYQGDGTVRQAEIDHGVLLDLNHTGDQVLSPAIAALDQLEQQLQSGTAADVQATVAPLISSDNGVLAAQAQVGSRLLQVKQAGEDLARRTATMLDQRDRLRDVDPAEAAVRVTAAQSALERAYAVVGRVFSTSLVDYLR
jgi:flagellar hook-associated protein 3 FlgL